MTTKLRVGIAGLDHWYFALGELERAAQSSRVEVVALAHRDAAKAEATATRFGVPHWTTDYASIVERPDVDVVLTGCYTSENAALCQAAAAAGKHIASVKPIAMTNADAAAVAKAVQSAGVNFMSGESSWRVSAIYRQIRDWVAEGRIGEVVSAYMLLRSPLPTRPWPDEQGRTWWLDATKAPGGGWLDHSIYHIDYLRWLLDDEVVAVSGEVANVKYSDIPFEDFGVANVAFRKGARATIDVTWTGPPGGSIAQVHIVGRDGQIVHDPSLTGKLAVSGKFDPSGWLLTNSPSGTRSVLDHLAEAAQTGRPPVATVNDAQANLAVSLAFYEAAREGRRISLG